MTAGEWAALIVGVAGVVSALSAITTNKRRLPLIATCTILIIAALAIAVISTTIRPGKTAGGATAQPGAPQPASPEGIQPENPSQSSVAPSTTPKSAQPLIRRQTGSNPLRLSSNTMVDLDSMEPNWDVSRFPSLDPGVDFNSGSRWILPSRSSFYLVSGEASYAACQAATVQVTSIDLNDRGNATEFCVLTSEGRFAFVRVVDAHDPVAFDIIVWEKS